jgi:hypothetical protein
VFIQEDADLGIVQQSRQRSVTLHAAKLHETDRCLIPTIVPTDEGRSLINIKNGVCDYIHKYAMSEILTSRNEVICPVCARLMIDTRPKFYDDAFTSLARYVTVVPHLRNEIAKQVAETQEAIIQSRALMAKADAILAMNATRPGWLWPAY